MRLFGKEIPVRKLACSLGGEDPLPLKPYVNLYIRVTDECPYNCPFCAFHKKRNTKRFDLKRLASVMHELYDKQVRVKKVALTGGEPTFSLTDRSIIRSVIGLMDAHFGQGATDLVLNTNGFHLDDVPLTRISSIALSRHHWGNEENEELFGTSGSSKPVSIKSSGEGKLHLRCNLIKGYVDSAETILEYTRRYSPVCDDFGFVSLMRVNDFCKERFVDSRCLDFSAMPQVRRVQSATRGDCCCQNYLTYTDKGKLARFYTRTDPIEGSCEGTLVYDMDCLTIGFNGKVIF
jgi:hypothetical protein